VEASGKLVQDWFELLHGDSTGLLHVCGTGDWTGRRYRFDQLDEAVAYVIARDKAATSGTYLRATTIREDAPTDHGKRAGAKHSQCLPGLWADIDIAGPGHKHRVNRPDTPGYDPSRPTILHPLPLDETVARAIVTEAALPEPTLWVHSGGGLYPWWLLDQPEEVGEDEFAMEYATALSERWQRAIEAGAQRLGLAYGNVGDLARVLRIPGTINRKDGLERPCRIIEQGGQHYSLTQLVDAVAQLKLDAEPQRPVPAAPAQPQVAATGPRPSSPPDVRRGSPIDAFNASMTWEQILAPFGWQFHHQIGNTVYWTRPGKPLGDGHSATTGHSGDGVDRLWCFSTDAGLPVAEPLSKAHVWGILAGHGGAAGAVKPLLELGYGTPRSVVPQGSTTRIGPPPPPRPAAPSLAQAPQPAPAQAVQQQPNQPQWCPQPVMPGEMLPPSPFPVDCLPPVMREMVQQVAGNLQVDPVMPALFALSTISAVAANRLDVRRNGSWTEALSLYTVTVADSGERKSPVARAVFGALSSIERVMRLEHEVKIDFEIDAQVKARETAGSNPAAANRIEDEIARLEAAKSKPPRIKLARDITPEALARSLARTGGHGAILDDEGMIFGNLGRYSNGQPNCGLLLAAYDGDEHVTERISRDSDTIDRPTLALGLASQPIVVDDAMKSRILLERGLLARIIFGFPVSQVGKRFEGTAAPYDPNPIIQWSTTLSNIASIPLPESTNSIPSLALSPEALNLHIKVSDQLEQRIGPNGDLATPGVKEWAHKHAGRILRIAALLHLAAGYGPSDEIGFDAMLAAIRVGDWAIEHSRRAHAIGVEGETEASVKQCHQVLRWIVRKRQTSFTGREACRGVQAQWVTAATMADALDQLVELGWLREEMGLDRAGRTQKRWAVSPHLDQARIMGTS